MIPIPPNQCVKLRQNKTVFGTAARLVIAVAPVVVRPDILSKTAEIGSRICKNAYGRAQIIQVRIQENTTVAKPSRSDIFSFHQTFHIGQSPTLQKSCKRSNSKFHKRTVFIKIASPTGSNNIALSAKLSLPNKKAIRLKFIKIQPPRTCLYQLRFTRQKSGLIIMSNVKISKRPKIIAAITTNLPKVDTSA